MSQRTTAERYGTVLFHCIAGKDRTCIIEGLLLDLNNVSKSNIVYNCAISVYYLENQSKDSTTNAQFMELLKQQSEIAMKMAGIAPENAEVFLAELHRQ